MTLRELEDIKHCLSIKSELTGWEVNFLKSIRKQSTYKRLSIKQKITLDRILYKAVGAWFRLMW